MSLIAVDASIVAKLYFAEPFSATAVSLFQDAIQANDHLIGPPLLPVEMTNVIRKRMRRDGLTVAQAVATLSAFLAQPIALLDMPGLHLEALNLSVGYGIGVHDAHYVALARMLGCELWVDDGRLIRAVRGRLPFVRWIGDYSGPPP